jgi:hypothetical protein
MKYVIDGDNDADESKCFPGMPGYLPRMYERLSCERIPPCMAGEILMAVIIKVKRTDTSCTGMGLAIAGHVIEAAVAIPGSAVKRVRARISASTCRSNKGLPT